MRIAQFDYDATADHIVYPDPNVYTAQPDAVVLDEEGNELSRTPQPDKLTTKNWGATVIVGNLVVGEYYGDDASIANYAGEWPVPVYLESFDSKQLLAALLDAMTSDQALIALQVPAIQAQLELLRVRTRTISISDAGFQAAINGLVTATALTAEQGADLLKGLRQ